MSPVRSLVCKVVCHLYDCGITINLVAGNVTLHAVLTAYILLKRFKEKSCIIALQYFIICSWLTVTWTEHFHLDAHPVVDTRVETESKVLAWMTCWPIHIDQLTQKMTQMWSWLFNFCFDLKLSLATLLAIYQARYVYYIQILDSSNIRVW